MRIVFIGCVDFSDTILRKVLTLPDADVVGVVTRTASNFNTDFCSLEPLADRSGIPCFLDSGNRQAEMMAWAEPLSPEVIYCFGWPFLLKKDLLNIPRLGVIGYHPTDLPRNRGRHPIIWTLALGLTATASSFFFMDEGPDSGDLLSQRSVKVTRDDDAASLYGHLKGVALEQVEEFTPLLASGNFPRRPQEHSAANHWRKRGQEDGKIDWRMPAEGIYNLVRALTKPYAGADIVADGSETKVWRCEVVSQGYSPDAISNIEPGRVVAAQAQDVDVRCGDGVIRLVKHELKTLPAVGAFL